MARRALDWLAAPRVVVSVAVIVGGAGVGLGVGASVGLAAPAARAAHTTLTIWPDASGSGAGGADAGAGKDRKAVPGTDGTGYGGVAQSGVLVEEQRELDVPAAGDLRVPDVASTVDAPTVQLTAPGLTVREQRIVPAALTATDLLARHLGETVSVVTARGETSGSLRAVDEQSLVVDTAPPGGHRTEVMRREFVQTVRLGSAADGTERSAALAVRVASTRPGTQLVRLAYRARGIDWAPDYVVILDDAAGTAELEARATIHNATGAHWDDAEIALVGGIRGAAPFLLPGRARIGDRESVQLDLAPAHTSKLRRLVSFQPVDDRVVAMIVDSSSQQDCSQLSAGGGDESRAELAVELETGSSATLPEGRARILRRVGGATGRIEVVADGVLHTGPGIARVRIAAAENINVDRQQKSCTNDESNRRLTERVELTVRNTSTAAQDVVLRELMWRMPIWKIDPATELVRGARAGNSAQEYRLHLAAGSSQKLAYTVVYTW